MRTRLDSINESISEARERMSVLTSKLAGELDVDFSIYREAIEIYGYLYAASKDLQEEVKNQRGVA